VGSTVEAFFVLNNKQKLNRSSIILLLGVLNAECGLTPFQAKTGHMAS
jgi:hypothetical protein